MNRVHVIGAGLAGLSAAVAATSAGRPVTLYEATAAGGGRCRSYFDTELGMRVDNGNHMLLSGNKSALAYVDTIGARDRLAGPSKPAFPFLDLKTGRQWTLRPNLGRVPWWLLFTGRRVPKTTTSEYLALRTLGREWDDTAITETMTHNSFYWLLIEPLSIAALNTRPHEGLACLFGAVLRETLMKGGKACLPLLPKEGLSEALIDPAIAWLEQRGATILFNRRITGLRIQDKTINALGTADGPITLEPGDDVILAVPPWVVEELVPGVTVPNGFESILNVHFKFDARPRGDMAEANFVGLVNGTAEWLFFRPGLVSVTVSAANKLIDRTAVDLASHIWPNIADALDLDGEWAVDVPPFRVIKERRATIAANSAQEERRPGARTSLENLRLAGDWTDTGLPGTIEGAIRSGVTAVDTILNAPAPEKRKRGWKRRASGDA